MSKSLFFTTLIIFALLQIITMLFFWFFISKDIWNLQAGQTSVVQFLQQAQQRPAAAPAK